MEERNQETAAPEPSEDLFEPALGDLSEELIQALTPLSSAKKLLVEKRRLAELRLEENRLRDELGDYDLELEY
ncbi:MAG: hypothetical protein P8J17_09965 [Halioglobus sp.]|nr:hypothetical protein [Halioglobus sp.]